jgi:flagellar protein FliO/FliZ
MDTENYLRFILALVFVIGLIGVVAYMARRLGFGFPAQAIKGRNDRRIGVVEVAPLDARRRLILVRRDDVEHLLVVSPTSETVIERGIRDGGSFAEVLADTAATPDEVTDTSKPETSS